MYNLCTVAILAQALRFAMVCDSKPEQEKTEKDFEEVQKRAEVQQNQRSFYVHLSFNRFVLLPANEGKKLIENFKDQEWFCPLCFLVKGESIYAFYAERQKNDPSTYLKLGLANASLRENFNSPMVEATRCVPYTEEDLMPRAMEENDGHYQGGHEFSNCHCRMCHPESYNCEKCGHSMRMINDTRFVPIPARN